MSTETLERRSAPGDPVPGMPPPAAATIDASPVEVAPGEVANATVSVTNRAADASDFSLSLTGLEPGWYQLPTRTGLLAPGATVALPLQVSLPRGHPPCSLLASLEARPVGTSPTQAAADPEQRAPGRADLRVVVGDGATVVARLDPADVAGGRRGRFTLRLRNRGAQSQQVRVDGVSPDAHLELHFEPAAPLLLPGKETEVKGRIHAKRPVFGEPRPHPFTVRVQGRGNPTTADGSYTLHPWLPKWASKSLVMGLVVVLWAAVAIVGIQALSRHLHQAASQRAAVAAPPSHHKTHPASSSTSPGAPGHASSGHGAGATTPSAGAPKKSSTHASTPGSTAPGSTAPGSTAPGSTVEVTGKVGGHAPGGVTVTLAPTSLVSTQLSSTGPAGAGTTLARATQARATQDRATQARATLTALRRALHRGRTPAAMPVLVGASKRRARLPDAKVYGTEAAAAFFPGLTAAVEPTLTTATAPDGSFVFTGVKAPGTYLLSFTEPGYNTRKYVVQTSTGKSVSLDTVLTPGTGSISGVVAGPHGPLGGATVTVTNGADTFTTVTPTTGAAIGTWSVSGLNTPDTYSVSASAPGYGTQVTNATLAASASVAGVDLTLAPGVGSISGTVSAATSGAAVGDVTVSATDGTTTVSATTSTVTPVGSYTLPDLAIPATWTLTITGASWLTQTQAVALKSNVTLNASVTHSGANVVGVVSSGGAGLGNVGLELTSPSATFKSLSESAAPVGGFDFGQIPPGQYVLKATRFGYTTQSASVDVHAGATKTVDLTLPYVGQATVKTGTITGSVVNEFSGVPVATVPVELDGKSTSAKTNANGVYTLGDVAPGLHKVTALGTAKGFADAGTQVSVAEGATVTAPVIALPALSSLSGLVTSAATGTPVPTPSVSLLQGGSALGTPVQYSSTKNGTYQISDITAGNYVLKVTAPGFDSSQTNVSIGPGQALTQDVALTQGPTFRARTYLVSANGTVTPKGGVCVVVARTTGSGTTSTPVAALTRAQGTSTPTGGRATFTDLVAGDSYVATFTLPKSTVHLSSATGCIGLATTKVTARAPSHVFSAKPDNTTVYGAVLSTAHAHISVQLEFPYVVATGTTGSGRTQDCPVEATSTPSAPCPEVAATPTTLPTVTVSGTTGYGSQTNGTPGTAQTRTVVLTHQTTDIWTWTTTSTTFVSTQVTLTVRDSAGQFETLRKTVTLPAAGTAAPTLTELLTPVPVPVAGTISPASGVTVTVHPDKIGPTSKTGSANTLTSSDAIGATEGPTGRLQWSDPATAVTGAAQPGKYTLSLSATGYETRSQVSLTIPLCQGLANTGGCKTTLDVASTLLSLTQEATLTLVAHNVPAGTGLGAPTASLDYKGTAVATSPKTMTVTSTNHTATATFADALRPSTATSGTYSYAVSGPGFQTATGTVAFATGTFTGSTNGTVTETLTLTQTGWLRGTLEGILVPGSSGSGATETISGARVTATPASPATGCQTLSATTGSKGTFLLVGTTGGLCPTHTYRLSVTTADGYTPGTGTTVFVAAGAHTLSSPLQVTATPITQKVTVSGLGAKATVTVSAVSAVGPTERCSVTIPTTGTATPSCTPSKVTVSAAAPTASKTGVATFTFTLDPVTYSFTLAAPTYETTTLGPVPYSPAETTTPITYAMSRQFVTITGVVTASTTGRQSGAVPVTGLPLTLSSTTNAAFTTHATTASASGTKGTYTFSTVPEGDYTISPGGTYTTIQPISFSTGTTSNLTEDFTVYAPALPVSLTLNDPVAGIANGTAVSLTPTTGTTLTCGTHTLLVSGLGTAQQATAVGASSKSATASFSDVVPDVYTVSFATGTGTDKPAVASRTLTVCPSPASSVATNPTTFTETLGIGTVAATVTLKTPPTSVPTVTVSAPTPLHTATTLSLTCTPAGGTCSATLRIDLGTIDVTAKAVGYTTSSQSTTLSSTTASKTLTFTLTPATVTVKLTVTATPSNTALTSGRKGATVVLTRTTDSTQTVKATTNGTGVATTFDLAKTARYRISVKPNLTGATAETLGTFTASAATQTVTLETGTVKGTVTLSTAPTTKEAVRITADGDRCGTATIAAKATSATYTCVLPPGTYTLTYTTSTTTAYSATKTVKVTAGRTTTTENVTITT